MRVSSFVKFLSPEWWWNIWWTVRDVGARKDWDDTPQSGQPRHENIHKNTQVGSNRNVGKMKSQRKSLLAATILLRLVSCWRLWAFFCFVAVVDPMSCLNVWTCRTVARWRRIDKTREYRKEYIYRERREGGGPCNYYDFLFHSQKAISALAVSLKGWIYERPVVGFFV